jgi:excisionase family DNA binding protein
MYYVTIAPDMGQQTPIREGRMDVERWLTPTEAGELLGISARTLRRWRDEGMPYVVLGERSVRYRASEITDWARARTQREEAER